MTKLVFFAVLAMATSAWAYSAGAPESTCDDMTPKHPVNPQKSQSPYTASVSKKEVNAGEVIDITISGKPFKGFILQVRDGKKAVGSFEVSGSDRFVKTINCGGKATAATHKNSTPKKDLIVKWKAPETSGTYEVLLTSVEDGAVFWVAQKTQLIKVL